MKQKEAAEYWHVRNTTVCAWEKDIAEPPYELSGKLCDLFEVSADFLLGRTDF